MGCDVDGAFDDAAGFVGLARVEGVFVVGGDGGDAEAAAGGFVAEGVSGRAPIGVTRKPLLTGFVNAN